MGGRGSGGAHRKSGAAGAREWLRKLCADPTRREKFEKALDAELAEGKTDAWFKAFAQGHGNPPQALDVKHEGAGAPDAIFRAELAEGVPLHPATAEELPN